MLPRDVHAGMLLRLLSSAGMASVVAAKLAKIVAANQLQAFYPPDKLAALTARVMQRVDFHSLAARWVKGACRAGCCWSACWAVCRDRVACCTDDCKLFCS